MANTLSPDKSDQIICSPLNLHLLFYFKLQSVLLKHPNSLTLQVIRTCNKNLNLCLFKSLVVLYQTTLISSAFPSDEI